MSVCLLIDDYMKAPCRELGGGFCGVFASVLEFWCQLLRDRLLSTIDRTRVSFFTEIS